MANLTENTASFSTVYKIEKTDPVIGGDGVDDISNKQAHELMKRDNYLKQQVELQSSDLIKAFLNGEYTPDDLIIIWGCEVTANLPGTSAITEGAIFYNDQVYKVAADASIPSATETLVFKIKDDVTPHQIELVNDATGEGIADYDDATVKPLKYYTTTITDVFNTVNNVTASSEFHVVSMEATCSNNIMNLNLTLYIVLKADTGGGDGENDILFKNIFKPKNTLSRNFDVLISDASKAPVHSRSIAIAIVDVSGSMYLRFLGTNTNNGGSYNRFASFNISISYKF